MPVTINRHLTALWILNSGRTTVLSTSVVHSSGRQPQVMTIRKRPWEKSLDYEIRAGKQVSSNHHTENGRRRNDTNSHIPHVVLDGVSFYSDRFYLNSPLDVVEKDIDHENHCNNNSHNNNSDSSVANKTLQPPLFNPIQLIRSLNLQAMILSTYTWDDDTIKQLLHNKSVPCLILHGQKQKNSSRCNLSSETTRKRNTSYIQRKRIKEPLQPVLYQQPEFSCAACDTDEEDQFFYSASSTTTSTTLDSDIPEDSWTQRNVFFTHILPCWIPPTSNTQQQPHNRQFCKGVHHPKYMLLFETDGSLTVVISTANLTPATSLDASWIQRFPPSSPLQKPPTEDTWDFGPILFDFLEKQSLAATDGHMLPWEFLKQFLHQGTVVHSFTHLQRYFDFSQAQVQLVSTIPGIYPKANISYGPQRIADILARVQDQGKVHETHSRNRPWLPFSVLSHEDRLIIQSTSWGGSPWCGRDMVQLVRMYLGWEPPTSLEMDTPMYDSQDLLDRIDILWPTHDYMTQVYETKTPSHRTDSPIVGADVHLGFFTSQTFNETDLACISRMAVYEPNQDHFFPRLLPPHLKTMARLLESPRIRNKKEECRGTIERVDDNNDDFAWILLTSACFSRGAQGIPRTKNCKEDGDTLTFANFELGVFFCSRIQGSVTDRIYRCIRRQTGDPHKGIMNGPRIIPVPIPYFTRPRMYQGHNKSDEDETDAYFSERPYFHEILDGTVGVGHMALIP